MYTWSGSSYRLQQGYHQVQGSEEFENSWALERWKHYRSIMVYNSGPIWCIKIYQYGAYLIIWMIEKGAKKRIHIIYMDLCMRTAFVLDAS